MPSRPKRSRRALSVTSLIDVIFLLLLFFMLTSTFTKFGEVELMTSGSGSVPAFDAPPLFLKLDQDRITLNGQAVPHDQLAQTIETRQNSDRRTALLLSLAPDTNAQQLTDVIVVLRSLPDIDLTVLDPA